MRHPICEKCGCELDEFSDTCYGCLTTQTMPEFIATEAPPVPQHKPFREQSMEERYRTLVDRLQAKLNEWQLWQDDLRAAAQVEEGNGNHGKFCGLNAQANAIRTCMRQLTPYVDRHTNALK